MSKFRQSPPHPLSPPPSFALLDNETQVLSAYEQRCAVTESECANLHLDACRSRFPDGECTQQEILEICDDEVIQVLMMSTAVQYKHDMGCHEGAWASPSLCLLETTNGTIWYEAIVMGWCVLG